MATAIEAAAKQAESALGENLNWLTDQLDLRIRQGDSETLRRLKQLTDAHAALCRAGAHKY